MKSNEERVNSIMNKAKLYRKKRGEAIASVTLAVCLVVSVLAGVNLSTMKKKEEMELALEHTSGENPMVEEMKEGELLAFASKEELMQQFEESAKKYQDNYGRIYRTGGIAFDDMEYAVPESFLESKAINSVAQSDTAEAVSKEEFSTTNVQTEGVDEADIIKTDGKRIYYINNERKLIRVFENQEGKIVLVKTITLSKEENVYADTMFLDDKHLIVIANGYENFALPEDEEEINTNAKRIYYFPTRSKSFAKIFIYDVNDYTLLREVDTEGSIVSSRKIGDNLYLVTNKYLNYYSFYRDDVMPLYKDTLESGEYCEVAIEKIRAFKDYEKEDTCNYMIITALNLANSNHKVNIDTYLGAGTEIYCSTNHLYVTKANYNYYYGFRAVVDDMAVAKEEENKDTTSTSIHKFAIKDGKATYIATGEVPGTLLNQFSMDEYAGNFRITTTNEKGNNLYVLDEKLNVIGKLENLAEGERIYSTRFMGDKAYVVTYKTVDPLFVIDLATPTAPKVLGELKIPGYSSYLHPLGDHYLLGFGEDSTEKSYINWQGEQQVVAYATGLKMAIFDVSDYTNPKEVQSIKMGGRGSYSELLHDHKALLLDEARGIIAFPASLNKEAGYYQDGTPMYGELDFAGALVYNFDLEEGFELKGKITHEAEDRYSKYGNINRIIYIGDNFYTVSNGMIKATNRNTMQEVSSLKF